MTDRTKEFPTEVGKPPACWMVQQHFERFLLGGRSARRWCSYLHYSLFKRHLYAHPNIQEEKYTCHPDYSIYGRPLVDHISNSPASQILKERRTFARPTLSVSASQQRACPPVHSLTPRLSWHTGCCDAAETALPLAAVTGLPDQQIPSCNQF